MKQNVLYITSRGELREWLIKNHSVEKECYVSLKRGKPSDTGAFYYIDAVEEALCFGWIDSKLTKIDGVSYQRFTKRSATSNWTELNIARCKRLEALGLMTEAGRRALPKREFTIPQDIREDIESLGLWERFCTFPLLYQKIRLYNLKFTKDTHGGYEAALKHFALKTQKGEMYGQWNDYGRLE